MSRIPAYEIHGRQVNILFDNSIIIFFSGQIDNFRYTFTSVVNVFYSILYFSMDIGHRRVRVIHKNIIKIEQSTLSSKV